MNQTQSAEELRGTWFRGIRKEDVDRALAELAERNGELQAKLAAAEESTRGLVERVQSAEGTLETFHATLEHLSDMLSMAEERARQVEREAEIEAMRIRSDAEERVRAADAELAVIAERKRMTLNALAELRSRLVTLGGEEGDDLTPPATVHPLPAPTRVTVADLLALEADGRL